MKKREVLAVIPARYGSKRFPGKPLANISGKTLLQRTFENTKESKLFDRVVVATDDQRIFTHCEEIGAEVLMTNTSCANGTERIHEALQMLDVAGDAVVVNIQGDVPLLEKQVMQKLIDAMLADEKCLMGTAATPISDCVEKQQPHIVKCCIDQNGDALYFSRASIPYGEGGAYHHLGIYAYRRDFVSTYAGLPPTPLQQSEDLEQLKALEHGYKIRVVKVESQSFGVDRPEDIAKVEQIL